MTAAGPPRPGGYELKVEGHLDDHWSRWFDGLSLTRETDGTTTLRGVVTDQAELHGLLDRIQTLGLELIEIRQVDGPGGSRG